MCVLDFDECCDGDVVYLCFVVVGCGDWDVVMVWFYVWNEVVVIFDCCNVSWIIIFNGLFVFVVCGVVVCDWIYVGCF